MALQDIIEDDEIKLDWFFKASMINDLVNVSVCNFLLLLKICCLTNSLSQFIFYLSLLHTCCHFREHII